MTRGLIKVTYSELWLDFAVSKGDYGPRRSNPIGEDDALKQKKQTNVEQINRLYSRLMLKLIDYTIDWTE